ncbi:nicotinate-nucleotide--dimethylbenzimidazole phosphoribosyltransferase [Butyrivibrio sp. VCD2006]|uniref:nicotinate-nucleotide--dimethylbenzimidazole phosphoribosyltransferase n=1 Tax=Butyrivibrio sp. VCD2006 TaxID=1280664 RepID=UPI00041BD5DF|nr:nicotinate-nucleotide--dimethylbenzimidazole phosphoribosyltransferase [Butyrivibrio sp. VCD2006]
MNYEELLNIIIKKPDDSVYRTVKKEWDRISKPLDGLGDFEELICRIAAIRGTENPTIEKRTAVIFCSDNGIVDEGISQSTKEITKSVAIALGSGISSACTLAKSAGVTVLPVDVGIDCDEKIEGVRDMKVSKGTRNFLKEPAMTEEEVLKAIEAGMNVVKELSEQGVEIISTGEMGIGNTTTSAAVLSEILEIDSDMVTGRGAGLDDDGLLRKKQVIKEACEKYSFDDWKPSDGRECDRAFKVLQTLGGLDIAALTGTFIGGALNNIPIVIDGVISATAALVADRLIPGVKDYAIASHQGREAGCLLALKELDLPTYICGNMALGEGTGALMLFPVLDMVLDFYNNAAKFSDYKIDEYQRF